MQRLPEQSQCPAPGSHQNQQQPLQESQLGLLAWGQVFCLASWGRASLAAALSMLALAVGSCLQLRHRYLRRQQTRCQQFVHTNKVREPLCETAFYPAPSAAGQTDAFDPGSGFRSRLLGPGFPCRCTGALCFDGWRMSAASASVLARNSKAFPCQL